MAQPMIDSSQKVSAYVAHTKPGMAYRNDNEKDNYNEKNAWEKVGAKDKYGAKKRKKLRKEKLERQRQELKEMIRAKKSA